MDHDVLQRLRASSTDWFRDVSHPAARVKSPVQRPPHGLGQGSAIQRPPVILSSGFSGRGTASGLSAEGKGAYVKDTSSGWPAVTPP